MMRIQPFATIAILMTVLAILLNTTPAYSTTAEQMELLLESPRHDYIIREPIKLILTLKNISADTLRIMDMSTFRMWNSAFLYLELTTPSGDVQYRECKLVGTTAILMPNYGGEPLPPGECVQVFVYPNASTTMAHKNSNQPPGEWGVTFSEPGTYRARYIYHVDERYRYLWQAPNGELYSNAVELTFRQPSPTEEEILNAIWGDENIPGGYELTWGDESSHKAGDESSLRAIIEKYPNHPMIKYAYFYLGKLLANSKDNRKEMESIPILTALNDSLPSFRHEEVQLHLGWALFCTGQRDRARKCFDNALKENPNLIHHYYFMQSKFDADTDDHKAFTNWRTKRKVFGSTMKPETVNSPN